MAKIMNFPCIMKNELSFLCVNFIQTYQIFNQIDLN